ncbi:hypothetical protein V2I01_30315 [Micromonospora sp. BRA006-A]|nr:hypothetical protein [Micromonospora sp. BRA006-A]
MARAGGLGAPGASRLAVARDTGRARRGGGLVAVLARWTGQDEVVLGLATAGGSVARVDVSGDPGFGELAARVGLAWTAPVAGRTGRTRWRWS